MLKGLIAVALALVVSACATTETTLAPRPGVDTITLDVGPCYGPCPTFTLSIASDGEVRVIDNGQSRTGVVQRAVVAADRYEAVADALARYRPPHALPECLFSTTDAQFQTVTWTDRSGVTATLHHYNGDTCEADEALSRVLDTIPDLIGVRDRLRPSQWGARRMR